MTEVDFFYYFRDFSSTTEILHQDPERDIERRCMVAEMGGIPWGGADAGVGRKQNGSLHGFVDFIDALGDLYDATPATAAAAALPTEAQYAAIHRRVLEASRGWLQLEQTLLRILFVSPRVAPRVLAYLLAIQTLAGGAGAALALSVTMVNRSADGDRVFAISTPL
jgi:hypothetical protein